MKIIDLYRERFVVSFEIFPPKTPQGEEGLRQALSELSGYQPQYISVTYGAGAPLRKTLELARCAQGFCRFFTCGGGPPEIGRLAR